MLTYIDFFAEILVSALVETVTGSPLDRQVSA